MRIRIRDPESFLTFDPGVKNSDSGSGLFMTLDSGSEIERLLDPG
jgi:hypothetical protein